MRMTKHHGLGNDFLVLLDLEGRVPVDAALAKAVCDRHRGIGADGLIRVTPGGRGAFSMELRNEDGSRAEMSGNGISCLAQAVVLAGHATGGVVDVETDAGHRMVTVVDRPSPRLHRMQVEMGVPRVEGPRPEWLDEGLVDVLAVDTGNPHLVCLVGDGAPPDLVAFGARVNEAIPSGSNVEFVTVNGADSLAMTVYERGVGLTQACGTGAVAAAVAAHSWGLVPAEVTVHQPGGAAVVALGESARLTVPVEVVADVTWLS